MDKIEKKSPNLINAQGGFVSPQNNKRTVSNKHAQGGFFSQKQ